MTRVRRALVPIVSVTAVLLLSGCSSEVTSESVTITPGQTGTFTSGDSTIVVGGDEATAPGDKAAFLSAARDQATGALGSATDADLLAAGQSACDQLDQGIDDEKIAVTVAGSALPAGGDDALAIVDAASLSLCG